MDDELSKLEEVLRVKAAEVPYLQAAVPKVMARARRRIARNAVSSVVAAALIVLGASAALAGIGAFRGPHEVIPGSSGPPTAALGTSCTAANLRAATSIDGAAGSVVGSIDLTNAGAATCTLSGRPTLSLSTLGTPLSPHTTEVPPQWQVDATAAPTGWPVVTLRPGAVSSIRVRWSNACPQLSSPVVWHVDLGGDAGGLDATGAALNPSCLGSAEPSTLEVGPFEPGTGR